MKIAKRSNGPRSRFLLSFATCALGATLAAPADATWSIVVVNTRTREVAVASATCLNSFNLRPLQAVVRVGVGAAASQATIDEGGVNRMYVWNGMQSGLDPAQMIQDLATIDPGHESRQIGIAVLYGDPVSFTGALTADANPQVFGTAGELRFAIQGNILAGDVVVANAEAALIATPGDLSQKVMAAMEAARATGGDGRCSCSQANPTGCGAPPPMFTYSAYTAYITVARLGDTDGTCVLGPGCANGQYWCNLTFIGGPGAPEPVLRLEQLYATWRTTMQSRADRELTRVTPFARRLPADGRTSTVVEVDVRNIDDVRLASVRTALRVTPITNDPLVAAAGEPEVVSAGVLRFPVSAGTHAGVARWKLEALHDSLAVPLKDLEIEVAPPSELFCGFDEVSASAATLVPFTLDLGPSEAGTHYFLLGTASGTTPGVAFEGVSMPLNSDFVFRASVRYANTPRFQRTSAFLDVDGRAEPAFGCTAHLLDAFVGRRIEWSALIGGASPRATNVAGFDLVP